MRSGLPVNSFIPILRTTCPTQRLMKPLLTLFLCLVTSATWAQSADHLLMEVKSMNEQTVQFYQEGRYEEAVALAEKAVDAAKLGLGEDHPKYATSMYNLAYLYKSIGRYSEAERFYKQTIQFGEEQFFKDYLLYSSSLHNLAGLYESTGRYAEAESLYVQAIQVIKEQLGEDHPNYATSLNNLAYLYKSMGRYADAEPLYGQATQIRKEQLGEDHPDYATSLNNLALLYKGMGRYADAEPLYEQATQIRKEQLGEDHPDYATSLNNLAGLYQSMGRYADAEPLYGQATQIRKEQLGEDHPDYATSLNNLAGLYQSMGRYADAEPLYGQATQIRKEQLGEDHPDYATSLNNLALLYQGMGRYADAEPLYEQATQIRKEQLGEDHPDYATSLNNLAGLYQSMGRYADAEPLYGQATQIRKEQLGEDHPDYATSLNNLALLYQGMGRYADAEPLYEQAMDIIKEQLGEDHPDYATSLNNLAYLYQSMGRYAEAEPLFEQAMDVTKEQLGEDHPNYATSLNNLAYLYQSMGRYADAEPLFEQAMDATKEQLGKDHPNYATLLNGLAYLYQSMGRYADAEPLYEQANALIHQNLIMSFAGLSEKEKKQYLQTISGNFEAYHSFALRRKSANPSITAMSYDNSLVNKGLLLRSSQDMRNAIAQRQDSALLATYDAWQGYRQQLARLYAQPIAQRYANTDSLEALANGLEKTLNRQASAFREQTEALQVKRQDVQKSLGKYEAALEFIQFNYHNNKEWADTTFYAALLLRPQDPYPQMIKLCTKRQLDSLLGRGTPTELATMLYASRGASPANQSIGQGQALYELIWQPLDSLLSGTQTVYFSPAGRLHQVAFAALPYGQDSLLMDRYTLHQLSSTRLLALADPVARASTTHAALFGGIHYNTDTTELLAMASQGGFRSTPSVYVPQEAGRGKQWDYLGGTAQEVRAIDALLRQQGISTRQYTASEALEEQFKQLGQDSPSPTILHVATHGFFFPDVEDTLHRNTLLASLNEQQQVYRLTDDPLRRAGLVFAGANHAWLGEKIPDGLDDGILTAYEVSQMNLSNTELVVLSACETGLGRVQGSEGVYGLQRAFKMAGAKNLIMSLWQVPDRETQQMMELLYRFYLQEKLPIRQAFGKAQQQMREKYDPYFWAAFTLVE